MKIEITSKNLDLTAPIRTYIQDKLGNIERLIGKMDMEEGGELQLKMTIERATAHHHKGEVFRAAADLVLPKKNLHAQEFNKDIRIAIDAVRTKLAAEVKKYKEK